MEHVRNFDSMEDSYLSERGADVKELGQRVLAYMQDLRQKKIHFPDHDDPGRRRSDARDDRGDSAGKTQRRGVAARLGQLARCDHRACARHSDASWVRSICRCSASTAGR